MLKSRTITAPIKPKNTNITNAVETSTSRHTKPLRTLNGPRSWYFDPKLELRTAICIKNNHRNEITALPLQDLPPQWIDIEDINKPGLAKQNILYKKLLWPLSFFYWCRPKTGGLCRQFCPFRWPNKSIFLTILATKGTRLGESRRYHIFTLKRVRKNWMILSIMIHENKWRTKIS